MNSLFKKTDHNSKITEIEGKMPSISALATSSALTAVENIIPDVSSLVTKLNYNAKINEIASKYITTADYNKFTKDIVDNSIKSKNLVTKTEFDAKLQDISKRITSNKSEFLLVENELKSYKSLIQVILVVETVLKKMVFKII